MSLKVHVKEPCSPKLRACVDALLAKGTPEDSAWAICRSQLGETLMERRRHFDFERIYNEFLACYRNPSEASQLYNEWLNVMGLDETREYAQARESYLWKKEDLKFVREDADNKYYEVEVGFPSKSMNGNVYKKRDLIAASLTLKGKHPSLNHKSEFWFSPKNLRNRWGNIPIVDGRFHEGISKALIAVPKNMLCPICGGNKHMTELIDDKRIVNVSLEGDCVGGKCPSTGECEGFYYTDPPFTLLTTDVLPGIPMTRIKPLESYMPSQSSITRGKIKLKIKENNKVKRIKIVPKIKEKALTTMKEETDPAKMGLTKPPATGRDSSTAANVYRDNQFRGTSMGPSGIDAQFRGNMQNVSQRTEVAAGTDPAHAKPEGIWQTSITEPANAWPHESARELNEPITVPKKPTFEPDLITTDTPIPEPDSHVGPSRTSPPNPDLSTLGAGDTTGGPDTYSQPPTQPEHPSPPTHPCPEGKHWDDASAMCVPNLNVEQEQGDECADGYHKDEEGNCVPDEPLDEQVKRYKAETREFLATAETQKIREQMRGIENFWVSKYSKLNEQHRKALTYNQHQDRMIKDLRDSVRKEQLRAEDLRVETRDVKNQLADAVTLSNKQARFIEDLKIDNAAINKKYHASLETNLKLSKDVTATNEEYLELAKAKEQVEEAFKKSKINAKKTLKIRV